MGEPAFNTKAANAIVSEVNANAFSSVASFHSASALSTTLAHVWTVASIVMTTTIEALQTLSHGLSSASFRALTGQMSPAASEALHKVGAFAVPFGL